MITANVKDVSSQVMNFAQNISAKVQAGTGADSFQNVLNKQTDSTNRAGEPKRAEKSSDREPAFRKDKPDLDRQSVSGERADAVASKTKTENFREPEEDDGNIRGAAMEVVMQLMVQVAETFEVSLPEVEDRMQSMGMEEMDLLSTQQLGNLVLEMSGAEGSFELVTDGELYEKFRQILAAQQELTQMAAEKAGTDPEKWLAQVSEQIGRTEIQTQVQELPPVQERESFETTTTEEEEAPVAALQEALPKVLEPKDDGAKTSEQSLSDRQEHAKETRKTQGEHLGHETQLPQIRPEELTAEAARTQESAAPTDQTNVQNIMRQILDYMKVSVRPEVTSLEMQLHPASLGTIQVQLASRGGAVTAQFIAQNEAVRAAIETQMIQLQQTFEEQGIRVEAIEVSVQTRGFEQNLDDQRQGQDTRQQSGGRGRRRIQIDAQLTEQQLENLTADERLTADMMAANGGTVDYTA